MWKLIFFAIFISSAQAFWSQCNIPGVLGPDRVESPFCTATSCFVERGQTLTGDMWFTPIRVHQNLVLSVTAFMGGIGIPIPVPPEQQDVCNFFYDPNTRIFVGCPTVPNREVLYRIYFPVPATVPALQNARVRYEFRENGALEFCAEVLATIV